MEKLKIYCAGAESSINQIDRIRDGFKLLGHDVLITPEGADIIYCNDPSVYNTNFKRFYPNSFVIYNVLDIPPHCLPEQTPNLDRYPRINNPYPRNYDLLGLRMDLLQADLITCICDEVKWQIENFLNIKEAITIYNPIKNVYHLNLKEEDKVKNFYGGNFKYLYVGRANDPNKRFHIVYEVMKLLNEPPELLAIAGTENPGWGEYLGVVDDNTLNKLYNSVEWFIFPSAFKSLGLPALESIVTKTKTIVCNDDPTTKEFWADIGVPSDSYEIAPLLRNKDYILKNQEFVNKHSEIYKKKFDKETIAVNIIKAYTEFKSKKI